MRSGDPQFPFFLAGVGPVATLCLARVVVPPWPSPRVWGGGRVCEARLDFSGQGGEACVLALPPGLPCCEWAFATPSFLLSAALVDKSPSWLLLPLLPLPSPPLPPPSSGLAPSCPFLFFLHPSLDLPDLVCGLSGIWWAWCRPFSMVGADLPPCNDVSTPLFSFSSPARSAPLLPF